MKQKSRSLAVTAILSSCLLVAAGCGSSGGSDDANNTSAVGGSPSMSYTVPQVIDSMKLDEKYGIDMDYQASGTSSTNMVAAVMSGEKEFAFPAATTAIDAINQGSDIVIVGGALESASIMALSNKAIQGLDVDADAPIKERIAAVKGMTIATSPEGSGNNIMLRMILGAAGLDPDKDVKIIGVQDPSAIVGGVKQDRFDGGFYGSGVLEANIASGEAQLWISTPRGDVDSLIGVQVGMVMVTKRQTLEQKPDVVEAMFKAMVEAERRIAREPEEVGENLKKHWFKDLDGSIFDLAWEQAQHAYPSDGLVPKKDLESLIGLMAKASGKELKVDYDKVVYEKAKSSDG